MIFFKSKKKTDQKTPKIAKPQERKVYPNFRDQYLLENAKFNIASLFKKNDILLEETLVKLIYEFYSEAPFFHEFKGQDTLAEHLVKEVIKAGSYLPQEGLELSHISLKNLKLQEVWYKILRGTPDYDLVTKKGWPPLKDFVIVHPDPKREAICFKKASVSLLNAFLGSKATQMILTLEEEKFFDNKNSPITKEELVPILEKESNLSKLQYMQSIYHKKTTHNTSKGKDSTSGIHTEIKLLKDLPVNIPEPNQSSPPS